MSKIRDLKKDIRFLCEQMIVDTLSLSEITDEKEHAKILELITEISVFHNELIARANHPDGKENGKLVKAYFRNIMTDLLSGSDKFYERMGKMLPPETNA